MRLFLNLNHGVILSQAGPRMSFPTLKDSQPEEVWFGVFFRIGL